MILKESCYEILAERYKHIRMKAQMDKLEEED